MPAYRHRPGQTPRPAESPADAIAARAPAEFDPDQWQANVAYTYGFVLFENGFYWEAHEVWEAVWQSCQPNSRERQLLQALIQLANAELKRCLTQPVAAARLLAMADAHLAEAMDHRVSPGESERVIGVDIGALRRRIAAQLSD